VKLEAAATVRFGVCGDARTIQFVATDEQKHDRRTSYAFIEHRFKKLHLQYAIILALLNRRKEVQTQLRTVFAKVKAHAIVLGLAQLAQLGHIMTCEARNVAL
jgi:hypothetical protein